MPSLCRLGVTDEFHPEGYGFAPKKRQSRRCCPNSDIENLKLGQWLANCQLALRDDWSQPYALESGGENYAEQKGAHYRS
jgi:hypothetical protein